MQGRNSVIRSLIVATAALILFLNLLPGRVWGQGGNDVRGQMSAQAAAVDWETRQGYELTHLNTWGDFRPSVQRAIAGYEAHEPLCRGPSPGTKPTSAELQKWCIFRTNPLLKREDI